MVPPFALTRFTCLTIMLVGGMVLALSYSVQVTLARWLFILRPEGQAIDWEWHLPYWITVPIGTLAGIVLSYAWLTYKRQNLEQAESICRVFGNVLCGLTLPLGALLMAEPMVYFFGFGAPLYWGMALLVCAQRLRKEMTFTNL